MNQCTEPRRKDEWFHANLSGGCLPQLFSIVLFRFAFSIMLLLRQSQAGAESAVFVTGQVTVLIYLLKQSPTHTITHVFLLYTQFFI